jgi:hypothetical protein
MDQPSEQPTVAQDHSDVAHQHAAHGQHDLGYDTIERDSRAKEAPPAHNHPSTIAILATRFVQKVKASNTVFTITHIS